MKIINIIMGLLVIFLILFNPKTASKEAESSNSSAIAKEQAIEWIENKLTPANGLENHVVRTSITQLMNQYKIPGLSMVFIEQGAIAWRKTYGYANINTQEKVTVDTVFTGASFSKPLTALAALSLVEKKVLRLDENVNDKLLNWQVPENKFTEKEKVTLRHLLSHRAGVKNDIYSSYSPSQPMPSITSMLAGQAAEPEASVVFAPGSKEQYSNPGYSIIQKLIEDTTKQSFDKVLNDLVFVPSNMHDSSFQQPMPRHLWKHKAIGYDDNLAPFDYKLFPYKAAGGVWTTPSDIAKFIITLFEDYSGANKIVSSSTMQKIFSQDPVRLGFAKIYDEDSSELIFRHYGTNQGFSSYLVGSLEKRQAFVVMTNGSMEFEFLDYIARGFAEYYDWEHLQPRLYKPYTQASTALAEYTGDYIGDDAQTVKVTIENDALTIRHSSQDAADKPIQISEGAFISKYNAVKYEFLKPRGKSDEPIKWLRMTSATGSQSYAEK